MTTIIDINLGILYGMNKGASSSMGNDLHKPSFEWEDGHPIRYGISKLLTQEEFAAQTIVVIDSGFTQAVYGQHAEKHDESRIHHMQTLHVDNARLDDIAVLIIAQAYDISKEDLFKIFEEPVKSLEMAKHLAETWIDLFPKFLQTKTGKDALAWCITAYTLAINPLSPIKLVQRPLGPHGPRGFGIVARRFIQEGEFIYELPGMIAKSSHAKIQSRLSIITPHYLQNQGSEERVLFGPLRFVNHMCERYNVVWESIDYTCGFTTRAVKDIQAGDELYAYYGSDYFEDLADGCPCGDCKRDVYEALEAEKQEHQDQRRQKEEADRVIIADKNKERNKKRKEKQKAKSNHP